MLEQAVNTVENSARESAAVQTSLIAMAPQIAQAAHMCCEALRRGGTIFVLGNGGSAAEAQHMVAELVGRFERDNCLAAHALTTDTSILTAVANDFSFDEVYRRQVQALVKKQDLLIALSTSGNSPSVILAIEAAKAKGVPVLGLSGTTGGKMAALCDLCLNVPSPRVCRIQECHLTIVHILCELIEQDLLDKN